MRYVAHGDPPGGTIRDCTWCQRCTGSAFGIESLFRAGDVSLVGDPPRTYRHVYVRSARDWLEIPDDVERYEAHFGP